MFFNNGNNRPVDSDNDVCGTAGLAAYYSSVPTFELNEYTNTAEVLEETNLSPGYSFCCGNAERLENGDLEYDVAASGDAVNVSTVQRSDSGAESTAASMANAHYRTASLSRIPHAEPLSGYRVDTIGNCDRER